MIGPASGPNESQQKKKQLAIGDGSNTYQTASLAMMKSTDGQPHTLKTRESQQMTDDLITRLEAVASRMIRDDQGDVPDHLRIRSGPELANLLHEAANAIKGLQATLDQIEIDIENLSCELKERS